MSLIDPLKTANHISNWIKDYATKAGVGALVFGLSGGVDSALVALLCMRTGMPVIGVSMPCHSSDAAYVRAKAFADDYQFALLKIDLTKAHEEIFGQYVLERHKDGDVVSYGAPMSALRSCLRSPTLSMVAHANHGLIVGTGNRSEDNLVRYFQKYGDGCVDISPIADLFKSEVYELFAFLAKLEWTPTEQKSIGIINDGKNYKGDTSGMPNSALRILLAAPTADLKGPDSGQTDEGEIGITYDEIEWADRENERTRNMLPSGEGIIETCIDPVRHQAWQSYTGRQRIVVAKIHSMEKATRHKINVSLPVCRIRKMEGLVR